MWPFPRVIEGWFDQALLEALAEAGAEARSKIAPDA